MINQACSDVQHSYVPICEEYIVTSKDCGRGVALIGWLRYNGGNYQFEYWDNPPYAIGVRGNLEVKQKIYVGQIVAQQVMGMFAPPCGFELHEEFCEAFKVECPCTNQWKLFEANWDNYAKACADEGEPLGDPLGRTLFWRKLHRRITNG